MEEGKEDKTEQKAIRELQKEDTLFKRDGKELVGQPYEIEVYDRFIDIELLDESNRLDELKKKQEALNKITKDAKDKDSINRLKELYDLARIDIRIEESKKIIDELEKRKKDMTQKFTIGVAPCTILEAQRYNKGKSFDNKESEDLDAYLIHKKCKNPIYSFEEAGDMNPDFRIAIKNAILDMSGYPIKGYRDFIKEKNRSLKKKLI